MSDRRGLQSPSRLRRNDRIGDPAAAARREELKYAHLSDRDSEIRRANREALADHIAEIQKDRARPEVDDCDAVD